MAIRELIDHGWVAARDPAPVFVVERVTRTH